MCCKCSMQHMTSQHTKCSLIIGQYRGCTLCVGINMQHLITCAANAARSTWYPKTKSTPMCCNLDCSTYPLYVTCSTFRISLRFRVYLRATNAAHISKIAFPVWSNQLNVSRVNHLLSTHVVGTLGIWTQPCQFTFLDFRRGLDLILVTTPSWSLAQLIKSTL